MHILSLALLLFLPVMLKGQPEVVQPQQYYRIGVSGGFSSKWAGGAIILNYQRDKELFTARYLGVVDNELHAVPSETVEEIGLLYGRGFVGEASFHSVAVGLGYVRDVNRGAFVQGPTRFFGPSRYEQVGKSTVGIAIDVQTMWLPAKGLGFGLHGVGNVNSLEPFLGIFFTVSFGKLR